MKHTWRKGEPEPQVVHPVTRRKVRIICRVIDVKRVVYEWRSYYWETTIEGDSFKFQLHPMSQCWLLICGDIAWSWGGRKNAALIGFLKRIKALSE